MGPRVAGPLFVVLLISLGACAAPFCGTATAAVVGDSCLVGTWTMIDETNHHGYSFNNVPVAVQGFAGAKLTITASGDEREQFGGSAPLTGTLGDGSQLVITVGGTSDFQIHASGGKYTETGKETQLPTSATVAGRPVNYHSSNLPGKGSYECSKSSLTMTTGDGNQVDSWSKG